jgi:hypothetical protein
MLLAADPAVAARPQRRQQNTKAAREGQQRQAAFGKARTACLEDRGYTLN